MSGFPIVPKVEFIDAIEIESDDEPTFVAPQIEAPFGPAIVLN